MKTKLPVHEKGMATSTYFSLLDQHYALQRRERDEAYSRILNCKVQARLARPRVESCLKGHLSFITNLDDIPF